MGHSASTPQIHFWGDYAYPVGGNDFQIVGRLQVAVGNYMIFAGTLSSFIHL